MSKLKVNLIEPIGVGQVLNIVGNVNINGTTFSSGSTYSTNEIWVNNLYSTGGTLSINSNLSISGSVTGNSIIVNSIYATSFYGDGGTLSNLPGKQISSSIGENSLVQNTTINSISIGTDTVSFGVNNQSNGNLSATFGNNSNSGSKSYQINEVINGKYILFLDNVSDQFVSGNLKTITTNTTLTTGTTTTTATTTTYESELISGSAGDCIYYAITNNTASIINFTYTNCETGVTGFTSLGSYSMSYICSSTVPTWINYSWMNAYPFPASVVEVGTCCGGIERITAYTTNIITTITTSAVTTPMVSNCNTYELINNTYPYTQDIWYTACTENTGRFLFMDTYREYICAVQPPTRYLGAPLGTAVTVNVVNNQCCINYNVYNPAWCPITAYYTDCHTGLSASTTITGYLSQSICSLTSPTFDTSCWSLSGYSPSIYSPRVTINSTNSGRCDIYDEVIVYSSVTTNSSYVITTACTEDNAFLSGLTGCTKYSIDNKLPNYNNQGPLITYTDCLGRYQSVQPLSGETVVICSSVYPNINVAPSLSAYSNNIFVTILGDCETLCVNYEFRKIYNTTIPAVWDVSYLDCDFNLQTVLLKNVGDTFTACMILGSEQYGTNISATQLGNCVQPRIQQRTTSKLVGGEITISQLTLTNGSVFNGSTVHPINITQIHTGTTTSGFFTGLTGVTIILTGFTGSSNYTILELSEELPLDLYSGKIVSNYFGLGAVSFGLETQAQGMASVSQNMFTSAIGDYSHAEGYGTKTNGTASHAEGNQTIANGDYSHAEGNQNTSEGISSHAEGNQNIAIGDYSHAEGTNNMSGGKFYGVTCTGSDTLSLDSSYGDLTSYFIGGLYANIRILNVGVAIFSDSTFDGTNTILTINLSSPFTKLNGLTISSEYLISKSEDFTNGDIVSGHGSHVEGSNNKVATNNSHAEGSDNRIYGISSHVEGTFNNVFGQYSHAEGGSNSVYGTYSHVGGLGNISEGNYQYVIGKYNSEGNTDSLFVVGNGTDSGNRGDALRVDADKIKIYEVLNIVNIQEYADNASAISGGLVTGDVYRTGEYLKIVY